MTTETVEKEPVDTIEQANLVAPKAEPTTPQKPLTEAEIIALAAKALAKSSEKKEAKTIEYLYIFREIGEKGHFFHWDFRQEGNILFNGMANIGKNSLKNRPRMILQHG